MYDEELQSCYKGLVHAFRLRLITSQSHATAKLPAAGWDPPAVAAMAVEEEILFPGQVGSRYYEVEGGREGRVGWGEGRMEFFCNKVIKYFSLIFSHFLFI